MKLIPFHIPLEGKLNTADNPATIGSDFVSLKNYRPNGKGRGKGKKGVGGMTKINSTAMDSTQQHVQNAIHLNKQSPVAESHIIAQAVTSGDAAPVIVNNETAIPSTTTHLWGSASPGTAANDGLLYTEDTGAGVANMCEAPNGHIAICDGKESLIWGGDEMKPAAVIASTTAITGDTITNPSDHTIIMQNSSQLSADSMEIGGGNDSATILLLHMDTAGTTYTDSGATDHTANITARGNAIIKVDESKFGTASGYFDGTGDWIDIADHADFNFSGDHKFTIDMWIYPTTVTGTQYLYEQYLLATPTDDNIKMYLLNDVLYLSVKNGGTAQTIASTPETVTINQWNHVAVAGNGTNYYVFVNGVLASNPAKTQNLQDYDSLVYIGDTYATGSEFTGYIDEIRVSKGVTRWTSSYTVPSRPYADYGNEWVVGSSRPLKGVKFYVPTGGENDTASTLTCSTWTGGSWTSLSITDNTKPGSISMAQTGTVTWTSTVDQSTPKYLEGRYIYWYSFALSAGNATIYQITVDAPVQKILDVWDGALRSIYSCLVFRESIYKDYTVQVSDNGYDEANNATFTDGALTDLQTTEFIYVGSLERLTALQVGIIGGTGNTTNAATITVSYCTGGINFTALTHVVDGTLDNSRTLGKSGVISWQVPDEVVEQKVSINGSIPLYYYKLAVSAVVAENVGIYYIAGIPTQQKIENWRFPMLADGCLWLLNNVDGDGNEVRRSKLNSPEVWNGTGSIRFPIGNAKDLTCGCVVSLRQEDKLSDVKLFFKNNEMWGLGGYLKDYTLFNISETIGCPAPLTLKTTMIDIEGRSVPCAIWQGSKGIYAWFGGEPMPLHWDIRNFFNENEAATRYVNKAYIHTSTAFVDEEKREYHWLFADSTSSGNMTREFVLDLTRLEWFEIDISASGEFRQCGISVEDTQGYTYIYGFLDTGFMERLEFGKKFNSTAIAHEFQTGAMALHDGNPTVKTRIDHINLVQKAKGTETAEVTLAHYGDGNQTATTGFTADTFDLTKAGYDFTGVGTESQNAQSDNHAYHSIKGTISTSLISPGCEPVALIGYYEVNEEDIT